MIGKATIKCACGASADANSRTGWVWDWKTGWQCPKHFTKPLRNPEADKEAAAVALRKSMARHPSNPRKGGKDT